MKAVMEAQQVTITQLIKEKYAHLNDGQKRRLKTEYIFLYGNRTGFFEKIKGNRKATRAEQFLFCKHLNLNHPDAGHEKNN